MRINIELSYFLKVTIIPRGPSLGHTAYIPEKERYHVTRSQLLAMMDVAMGGRAAEELIFGHEKITSGASSDLKVLCGIYNLFFFKILIPFVVLSKPRPLRCTWSKNGECPKRWDFVPLNKTTVP